MCDVYTGETHALQPNFQLQRVLESAGEVLGICSMADPPPAQRTMSLRPLDTISEVYALRHVHSMDPLFWASGNASTSAPAKSTSPSALSMTPTRPSPFDLHTSSQPVLDPRAQESPHPPANFIPLRRASVPNLRSTAGSHGNPPPLPSGLLPTFKQEAFSVEEVVVERNPCIARRWSHPTICGTGISTHVPGAVKVASKTQRSALPGAQDIDERPRAKSAPQLTPSTTVGAQEQHEHKETRLRGRLPTFLSSMMLC